MNLLSIWLSCRPSRVGRLRLPLEIARHDPGKLREIWRMSTAEMHNSAVLLAKATEQNDRASLVAAALRLDATCLKCHKVFLQ